jgi:tetratricopeptide (TPR) repeat protein
MANALLVSERTGMYMSAYELLSEVELSEDAIKCLAIAGRQTEAIKKADEYLAKLEAEGKSGLLTYANALCLTADIKRDASLYSKAWAVSNQRCSRAMRSLARDFFFKNKFQEAIDCFNKAFAINMLYPKEQFTCGCAHMKLEQWDRAIFVFGTSISIDAKDTEAWGNIANCYHAQSKYTEALQCTEQALKINRKSWRLWHNCIRFALQCNHFYKAIGAVNELIKMQHFDGLNG